MKGINYIIKKLKTQKIPLRSGQSNHHGRDFLIVTYRASILSFFYK